MVSVKRLSLQLTPLLDLLLIVIFAQYLEIEQKSTAESQEQAARQARQEYELKQTREELAFTRSVLSATQEFRRTAEQQLEQVTAQRNSDEQQQRTAREELSTQLDDVSGQRDKMLAAFKEVYAKSAGEIRKLLESLTQAAGSGAVISEEQITELAGQIAASQPRDLATFLLAYEEIRKRCDIWEIHLDPTGLITLFDGNRRHTFRAPTGEEFERQMFELYKSLPQAKGLVIMLISYGDVRADLRQNMLLTIPRVTDRMRNDAAGRTRFEYAVIGYLPQAPAAP